MKALAWELGRVVKMVHVTELLTSHVNDAVSILQSVVSDAKLSDGLIAIEGFEHILEDTVGHGDSTWKLHLLLSRFLGVLHEFPGAVVVLANIDSPQNVTLQRDFASKLYCFLRMQVPPSAVRTRLWRRLLPSGAPLASDVSFEALGRKFDLYPSSIAAAICRACGEAVGRASSSSGAGAGAGAGVAITLKDLVSAGEAEVAKLKGGGFDVAGGLFV